MEMAKRLVAMASSRYDGVSILLTKVSCPCTLIPSRIQSLTFSVCSVQEALIDNLRQIGPFNPELNSLLYHRLVRKNRGFFRNDGFHTV